MPDSRSDELDAMRQAAQSPGDSASLRELRESGRQSARERINALLDPDSFVEVDAFVQHRAGEHNMHLHRPLGDGVVACLLYTSPSPRDKRQSRMPSSA